MNAYLVHIYNVIGPIYWIAITAAFFAVFLIVGRFWAVSDNRGGKAWSLSTMVGYLCGTLGVSLAWPVTIYIIGGILVMAGVATIINFLIGHLLAACAAFFRVDNRPGRPDWKSWVWPQDLVWIINGEPRRDTPNREFRE